MNTLILAMAVGAGNPNPAPLHCPTPVAVKGEIKGGPPLAHTFELAHRGPGILSITKIEAGCGCLRQTLTAGVLQTGESAKLTLEVNTLTQPDGPNRWQAAVGYKIEAPGAAAQTGELVLQLTATLVREVTVSPPQIAFSTTGMASQIITITDSRMKPLTVSSAASSSSSLIADVAPRAKGADGRLSQQVAVKLAADAPAGHRDETITLRTDDPAYPELRIPVRILKRAAGAVGATPEAVVVRFAVGQSEVATNVQLRSPDGKALTISGAESDIPGVAVKWSSGSGVIGVVRVTVANPGTGTAGSSTVRVKLSEPAGQEIVIPVSWTGGKRER